MSEAPPWCVCLMSIPTSCLLNAMSSAVQVPRSSKVISEDNDYYLCTVVLFRRIVDDFKQECRSKGFNVPSFSLTAQL